MNKIDDDMKKLLMDKLNILRAMQGGVGGHRSTDSTPKHVQAKDLDTPKAIVEAAIEQGMCVNHVNMHNGVCKGFTQSYCIHWAYS